MYLFFGLCAFSSAPAPLVDPFQNFSSPPSVVSVAAPRADPFESFDDFNPRRDSNAPTVEPVPPPLASAVLSQDFGEFDFDPRGESTAPNNSVFLSTNSVASTQDDWGSFTGSSTSASMAFTTQVDANPPMTSASPANQPINVSTPTTAGQQAPGAFPGSILQAAPKNISLNRPASVKAVAVSSSGDLVLDWGSLSKPKEANVKGPDSNILASQGFCASNTGGGMSAPYLNNMGMAMSNNLGATSRVNYNTNANNFGKGNIMNGMNTMGMNHSNFNNNMNHMGMSNNLGMPTPMPLNLGMGNMGMGVQMPANRNQPGANVNNLRW